MARSPPRRGNRADACCETLGQLGLAHVRLWPWFSCWTEQRLEWLPCYADPSCFEPTAIGVFRAITDDLKRLPHTQPGRKTFNDVFRKFDCRTVSKHDVFDLLMFAIPQMGHRPARAYLPQAEAPPGLSAFWAWASRFVQTLSTTKQPSHTCDRFIIYSSRSNSAIQPMSHMGDTLS